VLRANIILTIFYPNSEYAASIYMVEAIPKILFVAYFVDRTYVANYLHNIVNGNIVSLKIEFSSCLSCTVLR
jgi:hypothetical protein